MRNNPKGINMTWKDKLKRQWNENPLMVIGVGAFAATAASKLLASVVAAQNAHSWKLEVNRRIAQGK
jgi:hypothetical protein